MVKRSGESGVELSKARLPQSTVSVKENLKEICKWLRENKIAREGTSTMKLTLNPHTQIRRMRHVESS